MFKNHLELLSKKRSKFDVSAPEGVDTSTPEP
nr:MAG TPA: hypothetical protein [Caudoviricetes sp.]